VALQSTACRNETPPRLRPRGPVSFAAPSGPRSKCATGLSSLMSRRCLGLPAVLVRARLQSPGVEDGKSAVRMATACTPSPGGQPCARRYRAACTALAPRKRLLVVARIQTINWHRGRSRPTPRSPATRFFRATCSTRCVARSSHVRAIFNNMSRSCGDRARLAMARHSSAWMR
jgi:hypothetical protein